MNISFTKKGFADAISLASRFAERRSATLPVLAGIAIVADADGIHFRATNLETGIDLAIEGEVKKSGAVALPAGLLRELASSFSDTGSVSLEQEGDTIRLSSGSAKSTLKTLPYDDFPTFSMPESSTTSFVLSGALLRSLIATVAPCASPSTVRPELASVLISVEGGIMKAVATDSFRLAEKKISLPKPVKPFSMLIPAKNALDIVQTLPDTDITIEANEHQCAFSWKGGVLVTRLVAANYPDYAQIIPKSFIAEATVLRKDLEQGLRRVAVFADSFQKIRVALDSKAKRVMLSARNADVGESDEQVPASITGEGVELSFNHRYLQTPLPLITSESVTLSASGIGRALVMKGAGDTSFLYLVMPMNQ